MGFLKFTVHTEGLDALKDRLNEACTEAEHTVAEQAKKDMDRYVPMRTGSLKGHARTIGRYVVYPGPYARYLYNGVVWVDPVTKASGFLTKDGWKSRKGVKKVESVPKRKLDIQKDGNPRQSHWFEASKAQNLEKWVRIAGEEVTKNVK